MSTVRNPGHAAWLAPLRFAPMQVDDVEDVLRIESAVYEFPWTKGNFLDSLYSGYETCVARDAADRLVGYFLMTAAVEEAHLLNISVAARFQGQGAGRVLLNRVINLAREKNALSLLLEVRPSNLHALTVYRHCGFSQIGVRKNYYPAAHQKREDAVVMRLAL